MATARYCWYCYAKQPADSSASAECPRCGQRSAAPDGTSYVDKLLWSLSHPLVERRIVAAATLARRQESRALAALRSMAYDEDPDLAAAGVQALARYPRNQTEVVLRDVAEHGPSLARHAAQQALRNP